MDLSNYKFNLQKSQIDPRDLMLETIYPDAVTLPETWDLRSEMRPIRDQGNEGTCSAQTVAAMKEWQEYADVSFAEHMSPWFIYKLRANQASEGMTPRDTFTILQKIGIVSEKDYKYLNTNPITEALKEKAAKYKIQGYAQINTIDSLKKALFANGPCYIAFPVFNPQNKAFWKPEFIGQNMLGGHAVCVAGYLKDSFIIRNSWSTAWGDGGYTFYPFAEFGYHWEIWTSIDADSNSQGLKNKVNAHNNRNSWFKVFKNKLKNK